MSAIQVVVVFVGIVNFGDEKQVGVLGLDLGNGPFPKLYRYHLGHVATKTVNVFPSPEKQDVPHLFPGVGSRVEVTGTTILIIHSVI